MYRIFFKRTIDLIISILGLIIISPIFLFTSAALFISLNGNPFFIQRRPGQNEQIFKIIKFRTMLNTRDNSGNLLPDNERLFGFGKIVRKLSLDEIPQLINVLIGDMSLIGPRPLLESYLPLYNKTQQKRHSVKPGITGWAQINGRNELTWAQKFDLDIFYIENLTFVLDLKILYLTVLKVVNREGINKTGESTTEAFNGFN